ncbi:MAG: hypothetical protein ACI35W_04885 [Anaeroplasmataceae bacterium]
MSIKRYMVIDFITLFVIGTIVELIAMYIIPRSIPASAPYYCVSVLVILVALSRWGVKGLILAPVMACVSFLSGKLLGVYKGNYDLTLFLSDLVGFLGCSVVLLFRKKNKKEALFGEISSTIGQVLLTLVIVIILQTIVVCLMNLDIDVLGTFGYIAIQDASGMVVTLIMIIPLRHQQVLLDVKKDLISKSEEKEMERKYYSQYTNDVIEKNAQEDKKEE